MSDPFEGVTRPDPDRERLVRSVFVPYPLDDVSEAISLASLKFHNFYVERLGDRYRWSFATKGGPYPLLRLTARFLQMDPYHLVGVGSRVVDNGWCVQIVRDDEQPDAWGVLRFEGLAAVDEVAKRIVATCR